MASFLVSRTEIMNHAHTPLLCFLLSSDFSVSSLFLVVKRKGERLAGESDWSFPQGLRQEGESMRDAVSRTLESFVGAGPQMYFVGYSPMVSARRGVSLASRLGGRLSLAWVLPRVI